MRQTRRAAELFRRIAVFSAIPALWLFNAAAQPRIETIRTSVDWPDITVHFSATCDGLPVSSPDPADVSISENGIPVSSIALHCPVPGSRCPMSAALVFDVSGSMTGAYIAGTIAAGNAFIDEMDGLNDEACVFVFNQTVLMFQPMTNYRDPLRNAVNSMTAGGSTALWDGIHDGIIELAHNGINPCRALVVVSDGQDNASVHTFEEVVALANASRIRIVTVALGDGADAAHLKEAAERTGGVFYDAQDPAGLPDIYRKIALGILGDFNECRATFQSTCADGTKRNVQLTLARLCNDSTISAAQYYIAPKDSGFSVSVEVQAGTVTDSANTVILVPIMIASSAGEQLVTASVMTVSFDPTVVVPLGFAARGALLDGVPMSVTKVGDSTLQIRTESARWIPGSGDLFSLVFLGVHRTDTACTPLNILSWTFDGGCLDPVLHPGMVCITPSQKGTALSCEAWAPAIYADSSSGGYLASPFTIGATVRNTGGAASDTVYARITLPAECTLVGPDAQLPVKRVQPSILASGAEASVMWLTAVTLSRLPRSIDLLIDVFSRAGDTSQCVVRLDVPAVTMPNLALSCQVPDTIQSVEGVPSDDVRIPVSMAVRHDGGPDAEALTATLALPAGIALVDTSESLTKTFMPSSLHTGDATIPLVWYVRPAGAAQSDRFDFTWRVAYRSAAGVPDTVVRICSSTVGTRVHTIVCDVRSPDTLVTVGRTGLTNPTPFPVSVTVRNEGSSPVTVSDFVLDVSDSRIRLDPTTPERHAVNTVVTPGGRLSASWLVLASPDSLPGSSVTFQVRCQTLGDTVSCSRAILHRNADSRSDAYSDASIIHYDPVSRSYRPMTWSTRLVITNTGMLPMEEVRAWIDFDDPGGGNLFVLDSATSGNAPLKRVEVIMPGADSVVAWNVRLRDAKPAAENRRICIRFSYASFYIGEATNACERCIDVEGAGTLSAAAADRPDFSLDQNHPNPVVRSATITYRLPAAMEARLAVHDILGREVRTLSSGRQEAGRHTLDFDAGALVPGVYLLRLETPAGALIRVMTITR